jgi:hypothetical protein
MNRKIDKEMEQFTFFWHGPFSNWHPASFLVDGIRYNCSEQFMMAEKARMFKDRNALDMIMRSLSPREQKALGRGVIDFDTSKWNLEAQNIVYTGCYAKFTQNPDLKNLLLGTRGTTLVEASPVDTVWGIGLDQNDTRVWDRSQWKGTNWLGVVLTRLREDIFEEIAKLASLLKPNKGEVK